MLEEIIKLSSEAEKISAAISPRCSIPINAGLPTRRRGSLCRFNGNSLYPLHQHSDNRDKLWHTSWVLRLFPDRYLPRTDRSSGMDSAACNVDGKKGGKGVCRSIYSFGHSQVTKNNALFCAIIRPWYILRCFQRNVVFLYSHKVGREGISKTTIYREPKAWLRYVLDYIIYT